MALMIAEVYEALRDVGVSEEKAKKAATALATYESRFARIDTSMAVLRRLITLNLFLSVAILLKLFFK